ncbi:MAG: hypothetical protein ABW026_07365 [Microvirga sp.]
MSARNPILVAALGSAAILAASGAWAQNACPQCGPQVPIKDIPKVLGEAATAMGLVRSQALLIGQINDYEMLGSGKMVDLEAATLGQPVEVSRYLVNVQQQQWASRLDFEGPNTPRTIRVVKGKKAWDESWYEQKTKIETIKKLRTQPADAVAQLRSQMVWLEPHAFFTQVAFAAGKKCLSETAKACTTPNAVSDEGGKTVLSVDINGQTYKGSLDDKKRIGSIETTLSLPSGPKKVVATFSGWRTGAADTTKAKDLSAEGDAALDKFHNGVFWPEKVSYEIDGAKVLDLTISGGWGNPYAVFPEPELIAQTQ